MPPPTPPKNIFVQWGRYSSLAFILPAAVFVGWAFGHLGDRWLGTRFLTPIGILLGITAGLIQVVREAQRIFNNRDDS
jgi:F0F1-type ATP synthase assembly protein I